MKLLLDLESWECEALIDALKTNGGLVVSDVLNKIETASNTKNYVVDMIDARENLEDFLEGIIDKMETIRKGKDSRMAGEITSIELGKECIEVDTYEESRCSCCSGEYYYYYIPLEFLEDDSWEDKYRTQVAKEKEEAEKKKKEAEDAKAKEKEEREKATLLKLAEKHPDVLKDVK